jgi:hypothetical protein
MFFIVLLKILLDYIFLLYTKILFVPIYRNNTLCWVNAYTENEAAVGQQNTRPEGLKSNDFN